MNDSNRSYRKAQQTNQLSLLTVSAQQGEIMSDKAPEIDIKRLNDLLHSDVSTERLEGATELARLAAHTRHRGAVRTRGSITRPAPSRLPKGMSLSDALGLVKDQHVEVRRALAFALGELAGGNAVQVLRQIADTDRDPTVREDAIDALGKIGGWEAISAIATTARSDSSDNVRLRSILALTDIAAAEPSAVQEVIAILNTLKDETSFEDLKLQIDESMTRLEHKPIIG
jgi:HEAT repeat protein